VVPVGTAAVIRGWWRRRGRVEHFDLYTRVPLYVLSGLVPVVIFGMTQSEPGAPVVAVVAVLAASVAQTVACLAMIHTGLARVREPGPAPLRLILAAAGLTLAGLGVAHLAGFRGWPLPLTFVLAFVAALSVVVPLRISLTVVALALVAPIALSWARLSSEDRSAWLLMVVIASTGILPAYRGSVWMLGIVWELERARAVQSRLAVAEERLRFSRELHDIVGRGLSVIALKSELAAQWAKRGQGQAADEMLEVRRVAEDLLTEVREVVRGYRMTDLSTELAGARSVLAAAGVECQVIGDHGDLPVEAQSTLSWVVREGTTNVLRHSDARSCTVSLHRDDRGIVLAMENDGVREPESPASGHGLLGLTERLTSSGGTVVAEHRRGGRFRLTARLPVPQ
jgi:two-component system sensor histidine kinase DesK